MGRVLVDRLMEEPDPQILWRRIGAGDRQAFTDLYRRHEQDVVRFCQALLHDPDDAREAANSTWAAVWRARDAAQRDVPVRPWLFRIAHNEAIDMLRRRRPHDQLDVELPAPDDTAADAEMHERLATLQVDLLALTDHQRTALVLREMSGLSHEEIGTVLDISTGAAKQSIYEARQALMEAEGGRSLSCELVRRDISAGDRRVLRNRRLRAHLRGCAACREFAAAVKRQRRDLRVLVPLPAGAALLPRIASLADVAGRGAMVAEIGGPVATKVAAAAAAVVLTAGAAGVVHPPGSARGDRDQPVAASLAGARSVAGTAAGGGGTARAEGPRAAPGGTAVAPTAAVRARDRAGGGASAHPRHASAPSKTAAPAPALPATTPPGQAKKLVTAPAPTTPQGGAEQNTNGTAKGNGPAVPPGQAKKDAGPPAGPPAAPPGQAKKDAGSPAGPPAAPPGQAKKDAGSPAGPPAAPPGQAKPPKPAPAAAAPSQRTPPAADVPPPSHAAPAGPSGQRPESSPTAPPGAGPAGVGQARGNGGR